MKNKVLIIRLSSFGDIIQCMGSVNALGRSSLGPEIHWLVRSDLKTVPAMHRNISKIWSFDRSEGLAGWIKLGMILREEGFTHVYDAHSSLRSRILCSILRPFGVGPKLVRRSKSRFKRILLFTFGWNNFPKPFRGMPSFLEPLLAWNVSSKNAFRTELDFTSVSHDKFKKNFDLVIAPSAAWEMKRWPMSHWKELVLLLKDKKIAVLGGKGDSFCQELEDLDPSRITNLAGLISLQESCYVVSKSPMLISADTGMIHVADILGVKGLSLIGPTAFGFPTNKNIKVMEVELGCRPCTKDGRGECTQDVFQKCMVDISPKMIATEVNQIIV